jgi:hypothetical protein
MFNTWQKLQQNANSSRLDLIKAMNDDPNIPQIEGMGSWFELGSWACPTSPIEVCVYQRIEDPAFDDCLFCHGPDERK